MFSLKTFGKAAAMIGAADALSLRGRPGGQSVKELDRTDVAQLQQMFPNRTKEEVESILRDYNGDKREAVEELLLWNNYDTPAAPKANKPVVSDVSDSELQAQLAAQDEKSFWTTTLALFGGISEDKLKRMKEIAEEGGDKITEAEYAAGAAEVAEVIAAKQREIAAYKEEYAEAWKVKALAAQVKQYEAECAKMNRAKVAAADKEAVEAKAAAAAEGAATPPPMMTCKRN